MKAIYLWFYCLPILDAVAVVVCVAGAFVYFHKRFSGQRLWKLFVGCVLLAWIAAVAWATVMSRETELSETAVSFIPLASYWRVLRGGNIELLRTNFMNTVLFFPGGMLLSALLLEQRDKRKKVIRCSIFFFSLSAGIETLQYFAGLGMAETDDIIHNTLGAMVGCICTLNNKKSQ